METKRVQYRIPTRWTVDTLVSHSKNAWQKGVAGMRLTIIRIIIHGVIAKVDQEEMVLVKGPYQLT